MVRLKVVKKKAGIEDFNIETSGYKEEMLNLFFERMLYERQMIWKRRFIDKVPRPWTVDPIFSKFKFCNVYRDLDRSSQWEIRNIILDDSLSDEDLVWKMLVYRTFNNPETFARALDKWPNGIPNMADYDVDEFYEHIKEIRDLGLSPFTTAYQISGKLYAGSTIDESYSKVVIPAIHSNMKVIMNMLEVANTPEQIITFLMTLPGASDFTAHEYFQDLTYIAIYTDRQIMKFTQNDFTNLGPGSSQGVRILFPNLKTSEQLSCYYYLQEIAEEKLKEIGDLYGEPMPYVSWNKELHEYELVDECNLTLNQIEGALCEFSKYYRIQTGTGRPRCPEFNPRSSGIIASGEVDPSEFITDLSAPAEEILEAGPRRRGRPKGSCSGPRTPKLQKIVPSDTNISISLNVYLDDIRKEVKDMLTDNLF